MLKTHFITNVLILIFNTGKNWLATTQNHTFWREDLWPLLHIGGYSEINSKPNDSGHEGPGQKSDGFRLKDFIPTVLTLSNTILSWRRTNKMAQTSHFQDGRGYSYEQRKLKRNQ